MFVRDLYLNKFSLLSKFCLNSYFYQCTAALLIWGYCSALDTAVHCCSAVHWTLQYSAALQCTGQFCEKVASAASFTAHYPTEWRQLTPVLPAYSSVQCSAVHPYAVQCGAVQCSAVTFLPVQYSWVQYICCECLRRGPGVTAAICHLYSRGFTGQNRTEQGKTVKYSKVQCSVQFSIIHCNLVQ